MMKILVDPVTIHNAVGALAQLNVAMAGAQLEHSERQAQQIEALTKSLGALKTQSDESKRVEASSSAKLRARCHDLCELFSRLEQTESKMVWALTQVELGAEILDTMKEISELLGISKPQ